MMAAATVALSPNVAGVSRCSSVKSSGVVNPALRLRINTLNIRPCVNLHVKRNVQHRPRNPVFCAVEDAASLNTKVDNSTKVDTPVESSEDPDGGIPSKPSQEEAEKALDEQTEKSKAILDEVVHNLKDVVKLQDTEKAIGVLKDTTEQLKEQAEKARAALLATVEETAEKGRENLSIIAEKSNDPLLKDIAETALNAHFQEEKAKRAAKIHDFCLGIPYGSLLLGGGLLWFLITGSTAAIRFGVFLGGIVLFLSVTSLKVWKRGESSMPHIIGQAGVAALLLVRELRRYSEVKAFFPHAVMAVISAGMLAFYAYVYTSGGNPPKKAKAEPQSA